MTKVSKNSFLAITIVQLPIVIFSMFIFHRDFKNLVNYFKFSRPNGELTDYIDVIFSTSILRTSLIIAIPLFAIFIFKKIGWLITLSFYYFLILALLVLFFNDIPERDGSIALIFILFLALIGLVILFNSTLIASRLYKIEQRELFKLNLAATIIAIIELLLITFFNFSQT